MTPEEWLDARDERVRLLRLTLHEWEDLTKAMDAIRRTLGLRPDTEPRDVYEAVWALKRRADP